MQYGLVKAVKEFFIGFFFVGEQYNSWMLWYLLSLFITSCMMYVLETHISHESITVLGFVLMLFGFAIDYFMHEVNIATYTGIFGGILNLLASTIRNGRLFRGLFFVPFGVVIGERTMNTDKNKDKREGLLIAVLIISLIASSFIVDVKNIFGYLINGAFIAETSVVLFLVIVISDQKMISNQIATSCRFLSKLLYFWHLYTWTFIYIVLYGDKTYGFVPFMLTLFFLLLIGVLIKKFRKKRKEIELWEMINNE